MRRLLVALYPARWRRRYGVEYLELIRALPLTPALVADVLRGAAREHGRVVAGWAPAAQSAVLLVTGIILTGLFWASWQDMYHEVDRSLEWRTATVTGLLLAGLGAGWLARGGRAARLLGLVLLGASGLALAVQHGVGPLPSWQESMGPLQVTMTSYAAAMLGALARFIGDVRRELNAPA